MTGPERNRTEPRVRAIRRRDFVALVAAALASKSAEALAQRSNNRPLIAVLIGGSQRTVQRWLSGLPDELKSLGYVEHTITRPTTAMPMAIWVDCQGSRPIWLRSLQT